jgi:hypothetical protein
MAHRGRRTLLGLAALAAIAAGAPEASAISRDEVVARAREWVAAGVPYCQCPYGGSDSHGYCANRPENPEWDPYRSDCSGYVSFAWALGGPGRVCSGFAPYDGGVSYVIDAADLKPGDAINCGEHIMLFSGWVDFGSVARLIDESDWGYVARERELGVTISGSTITRTGWPSCPFTAIRYTGITEACDGQTRVCGSDVGACKQGTQACHGDNQWGACEGEVAPAKEACNGVDDDCDGVVDGGGACDGDAAAAAHLFDRGPSSDIDGDGRADACALTDAVIACALSTGHGFGRVLVATPSAGTDLGAPSVYETLRTGDVNGDGRADACLREPSGVSCWLSEGSGLGRRVVGPPLSDAGGWVEPAYYTTIRLADVTGDGRADLCARGADGFTCWRSTGEGFAPWHTLAELSDVAGFSEPGRYGTIRMGDLDGDGRADVCARLADGVSCWLARDEGFATRVEGPRWSDAAGFGAWSRWSTIRLADADGDGHADLCAIGDAGLSCVRFDGAAFGDVLRGPAIAGFDDPGRPDVASSLRLGDLDGDGAADACVRRPDGVSCWLGSTRGFDRGVIGPALDDASGYATAARFRTLRLADVGGDGRDALCANGADGLACFRFAGGGFVERVIGPAWSDDAGFAAPARYESIALAGGARRGGEGEGGHGAGGGAHAAATAASPTTDAGAIEGSCGVAPRRGRGAPAGTLVALAALALGARARRRRAG